MYPQNLFSLIPPYPRSKRVFVAMSFDPRFDCRWQTVLKPGIEALSSANQQLEAYRVDLSRVSDAILTEILTEIAEAHCIVADISALDDLNGRPLRNANVMYEVGLAHSVRLAEEVILFRSDGSKLDFDVAGVRIHHYDPDGDAEAARRTVSETIVDSLRSLDARRRISIRAMSERLTLPAFNVLIEALNGSAIPHPDNRTMAQAVGSAQRSSAIGLLLELGALKAQTVSVSSEMLQEHAQEQETPLIDYWITPIGRDLVGVLADRMGIFEQEIREHFESRIGNMSDDAA